MSDEAVFTFIADVYNALSSSIIKLYTASSGSSIQRAAPIVRRALHPLHLITQSKTQSQPGINSQGSGDARKTEILSINLQFKSNKYREGNKVKQCDA